MVAHGCCSPPGLKAGDFPSHWQQDSDTRPYLFTQDRSPSAAPLPCVREGHSPSALADASWLVALGRAFTWSHREHPRGHITTIGGGQLPCEAQAARFTTRVPGHAGSKQRRGREKIKGFHIPIRTPRGPHCHLQPPSTPANHDLALPVPSATLLPQDSCASPEAGVWDRLPTTVFF